MDIDRGLSYGRPKQLPEELWVTLKSTRYIIYIWMCALISMPTTGRCDERSSSLDNPVSTEFAACDNRAEQDSSRVANLTPIAPTSVLNPILLLNDLNRRKQEQANQPQLLQQIEAERQQCRRNVTVSATRRAQETFDQRSDIARGYKMISFETFTLDAKSLAGGQARVTITGSYVPDGNVEWLFASQVDAVRARKSPAGSGITGIPLLTDDASREFRKFLFKCKSRPGSDTTGCLVAIVGHVSVCSMTNAISGVRDIPCIIVENGRELR